MSRPAATPRSWTWRLGSLFGIDTEIHASFLLILAWVALSAWRVSPSVIAVGASLLFTALVFGSVVLHELGHALTARRFGIQTRAITLYPIGGVASLEGSPRTPRQELLIAVAGPAVNLAIAGVLALGLFLLGTAGVAAPLLLMFAQSLLIANLMLAFFNMLPAFPMDGGRVLRAWLERRRGRLEATQTAATVGKVFAVLFGIYGLFNNPVLLLIAPFVWFAGERELRMARLQERFQQQATPRPQPGFGPRMRGTFQGGAQDGAQRGGKVETIVELDEFGRPVRVHRILH